VTKQRRLAVSIVLLVIALGGLSRFSRGLRMVDTLGLFASGTIAGAALAEIAASRRK